MSHSTIESWIDFREAFLKRFARPPFKSKYHHYSHQLERERDEEEWGGIPPHPELCHDYGLGDNPKKIQLFQLSLAGQAKDWAKFNAQHAFKTWNGYKGAFLTDLLKVHLCPTTTPKLFTTPSIITRHKQDTTFPKGELQAARQTKIEDMLQEYLRNQEEVQRRWRENRFHP
ncbi:unnamed protein product [Microthlaspi erraticum]|uniref:Retrotransposon gag domain-containing protein n=1 Tax=Microthlaspi erraticum TaxID=1685480 RepID=A0A6D2L5U2_9BRAS|nr:unnamed protein product [Microthlaspi erraticum]